MEENESFILPNKVGGTLPNYGLLQSLKFTSAIKTKATQPIIYFNPKDLELNVVVVVENKILRLILLSKELVQYAFRNIMSLVLGQF